MNILIKLSILFICSIFYLPSFGQNIEQDCFNEISNKNWQRAEKLAKTSKNEVLTKIVLTQKFLDCKNTNSSFEEIVKFIKNNPNWSKSKQLRKIAENYLSKETDKNIIIEWFNHHKPNSPKGYKFYALAFAQIDKKNIDKLSHIVKNGWIYGSFSKDEARDYLNKFKKYLNPEDHLKKVEEYIWNGDIKGAKALYYLLNNSQKQVIDTSIAIMNGSNKAEELFNKVPQKNYSSGLLYQYLKSIKKKDVNARILNLFYKIKDHHAHSEPLTKLQIYYSREFLEIKDYANAYKMINIDIATDHEDMREASWLAGWIALRFLNNPNIALEHFEKFLTIAKKSISLARGYYWIGRTYASMKNKEEAVKFYKKASHYSYSFYGQIAHIELGLKNLILPKMPQIDEHHKKSLEKDENYKAIKLLAKYKPCLALSYGKDLIPRLSNPSHWRLIVELVKSNNNINQLVQVSKIASQHDVFLKNYAFPIPYNIKDCPIEPALAYAIMRQESVFDQKAISSANAMGLMQLIKGTACDTAKALGIKCIVKKLTDDAHYNIKLGTHSLAKSLNDSQGSYILSIPTYNAGPAPVKKWINLFGDPREFTHMHDVIDWLELIGYNETRTYVQRVLENLQIYRIILDKDTKLFLYEDLVTIPQLHKM